jgi:hypothetical protein
MLSTSVELHQHFRGVNCLHFLGQSVSQASNQQVQLCSAVYSSETPVKFYWIICYHLGTGILYTVTAVTASTRIQQNLTHNCQNIKVRTLLPIHEHVKKGHRTYKSSSYRNVPTVKNCISLIYTFFVILHASATFIFMCTTKYTYFPII